MSLVLRPCLVRLTTRRTFCGRYILLEYGRIDAESYELPSATLFFQLGDYRTLAVFECRVVRNVDVRFSVKLSHFESLQRLGFQFAKSHTDRIAESRVLLLRGRVAQLLRRFSFVGICESVVFNG